MQVSISLLAQPRLFIQLSAGETVLPPPAPRLASLWGSGSTVTLNFTEVMDETSATNPANYAVTGGTVTGASLSPDGRTVTLSLNSPLAIGSAYDVTLGNLTGGGGDPLGGGNTGQFVNWDDDPSGIKVFILAGQSNMVGYGYSEEGGNPAWTPENGEPKTMMGGPGSLRYLAKNNGLHPELGGNVFTVDTRPFARTTAESPTNDTTHWKNNGESMYLIGKGMGEGMVPMLGP